MHGIEQVAVLGAGGKMGRGIALILLQEMTKECARTKGHYRFVLIDSNEASLAPLKNYLKTHLLKYAEKNINALRECYKNQPSLVGNSEIIQDFVNQGMEMTHLDTDLKKTNGCSLIFEAVVEDVDVKAALFKSLNKNAVILTNTSSIPISLLEEKSGLQGRIVGFHFYNPPHVQKLVELIYSVNTPQSLKSLTKELGNRLGKILVESKDEAGFIGNGHFVREIAFAAQLVKELSGKMEPEEALYTINRVTQDYLLRPMGIFQLVDYVGIDVAQKIGLIIGAYHPKEHLRTDLLDQMVAAKVLGGQFPDGSQKDGFFKYEKNILQGVYSLSKRNYRLFSEGDWQTQCDKRLGKLPEGHIAWKHLVSDPQRDEKIQKYLAQLSHDKSWGAELARRWLVHSNEIGEKLIKDGVCKNEEDLALILKNGFYHVMRPGVHVETVA